MADETPHEPRLEPLDYETPRRIPHRGRRLVWIGAPTLIGGVLVGMLVLGLAPRRYGPRDTAPRVKSASHLRQIGQALLLYANDFGVYPPDFETLLLNEDLTPKVFVSPSGTDTPAPGDTKAAQARNLTARPGHCSYVYTLPHATTQPTENTAIFAYERSRVNSRGNNFLFGDGHVEWVADPEARRLIAEINSGHNPPRPATMPATAPVK
jgi:prepilin-type processing-associated H-X9-DG protein